MVYAPPRPRVSARRSRELTQAADLRRRRSAARIMSSIAEASRARRSEQIPDQIR